jgi:hypothetical protein
VQSSTQFIFAAIVLAILVISLIVTMAFPTPNGPTGAPDLYTQSRDEYYIAYELPPPPPPPPSVEQRGVVMQVASLAQLEAAASEPDNKGITWDRGSEHPCAAEMRRWVDAQDGDTHINFASEKLLLAPIVPAAGKCDCGDSKCDDDDDDDSGGGSSSNCSAPMPDVSTNKPGDIRAACARLVADLPEGACQNAVRADAEALINMLVRLCPGVPWATLQLEVVGGNRCSRWHQDGYVGRAIITYAGPGTWMVDDKSVCFDQFSATLGEDFQVSDPRIVPSFDSIHRPRSNAVGLMKGEQWPGIRGRGLTHKAPNPSFEYVDKRTGGPTRNRLLLKIDMDHNERRWEMEEEEEEEQGADAPTIADLSVAQIKSIVRKAKGRDKNTTKLSAIEHGTLAQLKNLHRRMGLGIATLADRNELANALSLAWGLGGGGGSVEPRAKRARK